MESSKLIKTSDSILDIDEVLKECMVCSEKLHNLLQKFNGNVESEENKNKLITFLSAFLNSLHRTDDYFSDTINNILNFLLKIDQKVFNIKEEVYHAYARNSLMIFTIERDLDPYKHVIFILVLKVLIKFSSITDVAVQLICENKIYENVSAIVGRTVEYLQSDNKNSKKNLVNETLNYSLYLLYKFSSVTKIYTKNLENENNIMIKRVYDILEDYEHKKEYLRSRFYSTSIMPTSLLCLFNNLIYALSKIPIDRNQPSSDEFDSKLIPSLELVKKLTYLSYKYLINRINDNTFSGYKIEFVNQPSIQNHEYIRYFNLVDVMVSLNRFVTLSKVLYPNTDEIDEIMICIQNFVTPDLRTRMDADLCLAEVEETYYEHTDCIHNFENSVKDDQFEKIDSKSIINYLKYLRHQSKSCEGLSKTVQENNNFLTTMLSGLIELINKQATKLLGICNQDAIEQILVIIQKLMSSTNLENQLNLWLILLLKLVLREKYDTIKKIKKDFGTCFWAINRMNGDLFDFEQDNMGINNFINYYNELEKVENVFNYNSINFSRDLSLYLIIMIPCKLDIFVAERKTLNSILKLLVLNIFQRDFNEKDMNASGGLTIYETLTYIAYVAPSTISTKQKTKLVEGDEVKIKNWIQGLIDFVSKLAERAPVNDLVSFKLTLQAVNELIMKNVESENGIIEWNDASYTATRELLKQAIDDLNSKIEILDK